MKAESLKKRLKHDRPMTTMTIRMPEDVVIEELKRIAPALGFSGHQPLARSYEELLYSDLLYHTT